MSIAVVCPSCSAKLNAPDAAAGKRVKCPKCQNTMLVAEILPEAEPFEVVEDEPPPAKAPTRVKADVSDDDDDDDRDQKPRKKLAKAQRNEDEDDDRPRKKSAAGNANLIRNIIGVAVLIPLLGVAGYIFYDRFKGDKEEKTTKAPSDPTPPTPQPIIPLPGEQGGPIPAGGPPVMPPAPPGKGQPIGTPGQPTTLTSPSGFKVTFPGRYVIDQPRQSIRDEIGYPIRMYVGEPTGQTLQLFAAAVVELPADATADEKKKAYDSVIRTLLEQDGNKVEIVSRQNVMAGGRTWEEIKVRERKKMIGTTRLLQTDTGIFLLLVLDDGAAERTDAAKKFFDSFELTK